MCCGKMFQGNRKAKYCSRSCSSKAYHSQPKFIKTCKYCHKSFTTYTDSQVYCSADCGRFNLSSALPTTIRTCDTCESIFTPTFPNQIRCHECRSVVARAKKMGRNGRRRALKRQAMVERFSGYEIFERDGWVCGICHKPVDKSISCPHPQSVSLDHIIPLSRGGSHSRANVQCAHFGCNSRKRNK